MIVVDTNVIAYYLIRGERSEAMDRLYCEDSHWVAPRLWLDEFTNILCNYERNGFLKPKESLSILSDALLLMDDCSYDIPPERVLAVARRTGCSGYDSQYLALAEDLGLKLYTCDKKMLDVCPNVASLPI